MKYEIRNKIRFSNKNIRNGYTTSENRCIFVRKYAKIFGTKRYYAKIFGTPLIQYNWKRPCFVKKGVKPGETTLFSLDDDPVL